MPRKFFVGGNFKANGSTKAIQTIVDNLNSASLDPNTEVVIAPPDLFVLSTAEKASNGVKVAAQNVFDKPNGAWTGESTVSMLVEHGIEWVILGHSERRTIFKESDEFVADKTKAAIAAGLNVILCIGETLEEREAGATIGVCNRQLQAVVDKITTADWSKIVIAYEPVWAIGTGKVATTEQAQEVHEALRKWLATAVSPEVAEATRILYGGSVSAKNSKDLAKQPDIDGFLVGGASLKPEFVDIINSNL
ncbi:hypothetical protein ABW19_dt0207421 [Dactylella cylindrospora]|nr:hypothetical protein ABW19_dt0207421 [Dactylella cylindrospora]